VKVVFIIKGDPFSWKAHEAMRLATAAGINNEVDLVFIRDGVYTLTRWKPEELGIDTFEKFFENLEFVNVRLIAEDASLQERGIRECDCTEGVLIMSAEEISELINSAEAVFVW
jgi:tRNA 2-thiouridine synthesizing protein C